MFTARRGDGIGAGLKPRRCCRAPRRLPAVPVVLGEARGVVASACGYQLGVFGWPECRWAAVRRPVGGGAARGGCCRSAVSSTSRQLRLPPQTLGWSWWVMGRYLRPAVAAESGLECVFACFVLCREGVSPSSMHLPFGIVWHTPNHPATTPRQSVLELVPP